ncbi:hypothetical protein [Frankia sp. QA3]|uniref:hypothetical protein n=1 Tax=Frankia sp. QA3 TaxID=710111 RepID=UPI000269BFED|nr:hypothetical protein [Frankia sp. QA3]EIV92469.1 hypothetical protein FraQA3DRAFT_2037 [Frankia sp. QA3]
MSEAHGPDEPFLDELEQLRIHTNRVIQETERAVRVTSTVAALAAAGVGRDPLRPDVVSVIDFTPANHRYGAVHADLATLPPGLQRHGAVHCLEHLEALADLVKTRAPDDAYTVDLVADCRFVILNGLHRCRGLDASPYGYGAAGVGVPLDFLLKEGSEAGVFVIATIDTGGLRRVHRDILNQFGIVLTRRHSESYDGRVGALVGRPTSRLRDGQALLVDDGHMTRLRPYEIPPPGWLEAFGRTLPPVWPPTAS